MFLPETVLLTVYEKSWKIYAEIKYRKQGFIKREKYIFYYARNTVFDSIKLR